MLVEDPLTLFRDSQLILVAVPELAREAVIALGNILLVVTALRKMYTTNLDTAFKEKINRSPALRSLEMAKVFHPLLNITLGLTSSP